MVNYGKAFRVQPLYTRPHGQRNSRRDGTTLNQQKTGIQEKETGYFLVLSLIT